MGNGQYGEALFKSPLNSFYLSGEMLTSCLFSKFSQCIWPIRTNVCASVGTHIYYVYVVVELGLEACERLWDSYLRRIYANIL